MAGFSEYHALFLSAATENIARLRNGIASLEQNEDDKEVIKLMHIAAHSLKGECLVMGYQQLGTLSFIMEKIFQQAKETQTTPTQEVRKNVQSVIENIAIVLEQLEQQKSEPDMSAQIKSLEAVSGIDATL